MAPITNCQRKNYAESRQTQNQLMKAQDPDQMDNQEAPSSIQATAQPELAPLYQTSLLEETEMDALHVQAQASHDSLFNQAQGQTSVSTQEELIRLRHKAQPRKTLRHSKKEVKMSLLKLMGSKKEGQLGRSSY
ncbi:hypothetical protein DSO57_1032796 [Entomophthora muscae]|uniref:Uncharacterized protein n=1 Tax=Entomophthora muscae TaxID=34485 RepID=A0ACC2TMB0_9FUNG|nr:hypothetical protein DSO57_1032796 [Entomophthora muscae]